MKFHNQRSFMGHEISNVNNKPLLHKKGKQWIVVAVSALILAGFGSMVSTTTHADTTATQPTTTKVAPKPANTSANVMKQAQGMHKALANNAAVQKPSAPSSTTAKTTAPASATSTSAKSGSVSASSSTSSKASSSVNSANAKSSSVSSNSNSSNNKSTKPAVHMLGMGTPAPTAPKDNLAPQGVSQTGIGKWSNNTGSATWNLYANGQLDLHDGTVTGGWPSNLNRNSVKYFNTSHIINRDNLPFGNYNVWNMFQSDQAIKDINLSGLPQNWTVSGNWGHAFCNDYNVSDINLGHPNTSNNWWFDTMFTNDYNLTSIEGLSDFHTDNARDMSNMFYNCPKLTNLNLSNFNTVNVPTSGQTDYVNGSRTGTSGTKDMFKGDTGLKTITVGPNSKFSSDSAISSFFINNNKNSLSDAHVLDDNKSHAIDNKPTVYTLFQNPKTSTTGVGKWGHATWGLDKYGNMIVADGTLSENNNEGSMFANTGMTPEQAHSVKTMTFINAIAPSDSWRLFNDEANHVFTNLTTMNVSGLDTSHVTTFGAMFCGLNALTTIKGLSDWKINSTPDTSWMFAWLPKINQLDLSKLSSNNTSNMFDGDTNLNQLTLGSNIKLTKASNLGSTEVNNSESISKSIDNPLLQSTNNAVVEPSEDGQSHPGTWNIIKDDQYGKWINNSAYWHLDTTNGHLIVYDGTLDQGSQNDGYGNLLAETGMNPQQAQNVKSISFINASTPQNSGRLFDDENRSDFNNLQEIDVAGLNTSNTNNFFAMFCGLKGLQHIDNLPHLDMNSIQGNGNTWMFGADPSLQSLDLSKAKMSPKYGDGAMFIGDHSLRQLTIGPNVTFDGSTNLSNFSNDFLQNKNTKQVVNIQDINNKNNSYNSANNVWTVVYQATINYVNSGKNLATENLINTTSNTSFNLGTSPEGLPQGYQVDNPTQRITYNNTSYNVHITPKPETDTIDYTYNNSQIGSTFTSTGNDDQALNASNTSFAVTSAPANYHIASGATSKFGYDGSSHSVAVEPNSVINTIKFSGDGNYSSNVSGLYNASGHVSAPSGYHYINNDNGNFNYGANNTSYTFSVAPNPASETINYIYNSGSNKYNEGSTIMKGHYNESGNANGTSGLNPGYQLSNSSNIFTYSNGSASFSVNVEPSSASADVQYQYNSKTVTSDTTDYHGNDSRATDAGDNSVDITPSNDKGLPAGWHLVSDSTNVPFDNGKHGVKLAPNQRTNNVNYQYNGKTIRAHQFSGNDYRATQAGNNSFDITKTNEPNIPAGYHLANRDNKFDYNGSTDPVNILPNKDTDIVNYQSDGKTLASQQFTGNDEHATQAGDNSFDVTAKNDSKIPSGYELVNSDNAFSFDNGIHDVAIQPIPQSVPYIMPTSSAAAPVTTVATPTSEAPTVSKPASHYRYAKVITPLQLHTSKHFTKKNGVLTIKHPTSFKIMKIVHDHKLTRYEVKYQGHKYFITGNDHFTINNYVQKHDFKSHKHMMVKVITPMIEYKHAHFNRKYAIKVFKKGAILPVKRVFTIGKGEMTRFELTNGRFVTSNKLFVKVIK